MYTEIALPIKFDLNVLRLSIAVTSAGKIRQYCWLVHLRYKTIVHQAG